MQGSPVCFSTIVDGEVVGNIVIHVNRRYHVCWTTEDAPSHAPVRMHLRWMCGRKERIVGRNPNIADLIERFNITMIAITR